MATNRDKITNEMLATFIFDGTYKHCDYCILKGSCYSGRCESRGTCINNIVSWLSQEAEEERTCGSCKFHKNVKPCIGAIDKKCVNPRSESCGTYTMDDCSCDVWEAKDSWGIDENHTQVANIPNETKKVELTEEDNNKTIFIQLPKDEITSKAIETLFLELHTISARLDKLEEERKTKEPKDFAEADISCGVIEKTADEMFEKLGYITLNKHSPFEYTLNRSNTQIIVRDDGYSKHIFDFENNRISQTITEAEDKAIHKKLEELKNENNKN